MRTVGIVLASLLAGCAAQPELTILLGPKRAEGESAVGATFMLIQRVGKRGACGYVHSSNPADGAPFNSREEITLDTAGCGFRWGGR